MPISQIFNEDNMVGMSRFPDKYFDLAIIDPPYGIGEDGKSNHSRNKYRGSKSVIKNNTRGKVIPSKKYEIKDWDKKPPSKDYFLEVIRVSKNQIIWGANHFIILIPFDSPCWLVWDKDNSGDFADCELAWASFETAVRKYKFRWNGMLQGDMKNKEVRIHPTQKPVQLYKWILQNYAKPGDKIIDTHMGSGSSRIAAWKMGFDFYGWEIDSDYFREAQKRFNNEKIKAELF